MMTLIPFKYSAFSLQEFEAERRERLIVERFDSERSEIRNISFPEDSSL
jgi:hypothetical protein